MSRKPAPQPIYTFRGDMKFVYCIFFRPNDPNSYAYCGVDGEVQIWDIKLYRLAGRIDVGSAPVVQVAECVEHLITQEKGGTIRGWASTPLKSAPFTNWAPAWCIHSESVTLCKIAATPIGVWCPTHDNKICRYSLGKPSSLPWSPEANSGLVMAMRPMPGGGALVVCESGTVTVISPDGKSCSPLKLDLSPGEIPTSLDCVNSVAVIGSSSTDLIKVSVTSDSVTITGRTTMSSPGVSAVALRGDSALVAVATWMRSVKVFSVRSLRLLAVLTQPATVEALVWTDHNGFVYCGDNEGRVSMYSLYPPAAALSPGATSKCNLPKENENIVDSGPDKISAELRNRSNDSVLDTKEMVGDILKVDLPNNKNAEEKQLSETASDENQFGLHKKCEPQKPIYAVTVENEITLEIDKNDNLSETDIVEENMTDTYLGSRFTSSVNADEKMSEIREAISNLQLTDAICSEIKEDETQKVDKAKINCNELLFMSADVSEEDDFPSQSSNFIQYVVDTGCLPLPEGFSVLEDVNIDSLLMPPDGPSRLINDSGCFPKVEDVLEEDKR